MSFERFVNNYLLDLKPYRSVSQEIWEKDENAWDTVLKLDWNEATIEPGEKVCAALEDYWRTHRFLHLYPSTANSRLIQAISQYANVPASNVQYFSSSDSLHEYIFKAEMWF